VGARPTPRKWVPIATKCPALCGARRGPGHAREFAYPLPCEAPAAKQTAAYRQDYAVQCDRPVSGHPRHRNTVPWASVNTDEQLAELQAAVCQRSRMAWLPLLHKAACKTVLTGVRVETLKRYGIETALTSRFPDRRFWCRFASSSPKGSAHKISKGQRRCSRNWREAATGTSHNPVQVSTSWTSGHTRPWATNGF
jgi:hypothetical protein